MATAPLMPSTGSSTRKASKEVRRLQLIEATIDELARKGYASLTMADVARAAGLSGGIVNFHFESKEKLLIETLKHLAEEYRDNWRRALMNSGPGAANKLASIMVADFDESICTPRKLAAWSGFWAEAQNRPYYLEHCAANDLEYHETIKALCAELIEEGQYPDRDAGMIARAVDAILEGLWLDLMISSNPVSLEMAVQTVEACLVAFFPKHFGGKNKWTGKQIGVKINK